MWIDEYPRRVDIYSFISNTLNFQWLTSYTYFKQWLQLAGGRQRHSLIELATTKIAGLPQSASTTRVYHMILSNRYSHKFSLTHGGRDKWTPFCRRHCQINFVNENIYISIKISLTLIPKGPINNIPTLVQIMVWHRPGDKPLFEPMVISLLTHIWVTRPQQI